MKSLIIIFMSTLFLAIPVHASNLSELKACMESLHKSIDEHGVKFNALTDKLTSAEKKTLEHIKVEEGINAIDAINTVVDNLSLMEQQTKVTSEVLPVK